MTVGPAFPGVLEAARAGADWAFEVLYRDLAPSVIGYLRGQGAPEPEDAASEVFVGVVRNINSFEGDERAFRTWVFSIAHNRLIDQRRRRARRPVVVTDPSELTERVLEAGAPPPGQEIQARLPGPAARALLDLSPDQRAVVLLRVVADLSVAEVAEILGKSLGGVKALQRRALGALAKSLQGEGVS
jgi:RNA polymerase sigma factor (sigma-70 family)